MRKRLALSFLILLNCSVQILSYAVVTYSDRQNKQSLILVIAFAFEPETWVSIKRQIDKQKEKRQKVKGNLCLFD